MPSVVADTSPIFYLLTIGRTHVLEQLFGEVYVPSAVRQELQHPAAPVNVRDWMVKLPAWMVVKDVPTMDDPNFGSLGLGERAAIALALSLGAGLILMDDRKGTAAALRKGLEVTGTSGVLTLAARRGLVDLADCFARLKQTNFRYRPEIMEAIVATEKTQ